MATRFPALVIVAALALSACGSTEVALPGSSVGVAPVSPSPATAPSSAAPEIQRSVAQEGNVPAPSRSRSPKPKASETPRGGGPADHNTMPLEVRLNRTCARPGDTMTATAETLPRSKLAFAASYSDNDFAPNFTYVPAEGNQTGTFTWAWEITPAHPRGDALVTVVAANSEGDESRGASYEAPFRVADAC